MQTNYKKLDWFEALTVCMIVFGIGLVGVLTFNSLSTKKQLQVAQGFEILDMHDQVPEVLNTIQLVAYDAPQDFLDKFYIAFTEVATIPPEQLSLIGQLPQQIKIVYNDLFSVPSQVAESGGPGRVLGASIDNTADCSPPRLDNSLVEAGPPKQELIRLPQIDIQKYLKVEIKTLSYKP